MPTKKTTKKAVEKTDKKCDCKNCDCKKECRCASYTQSQLSFYIMIILLVVALTTLVICVFYSGAIQDLRKNDTSAYTNMFTTESTGDKKDDNGITVLSAGAVIDMLAQHKSGFVLLSEENDPAGNVFSNWIGSVLSDTKGVYRYIAPSELTDTDKKVQHYLGDYTNTPDFIYIKDGVVYDRIDDARDKDGLVIFLKKYASAE